VVAGLLNQGYGQALGAAQQQQGVNLSAEQANRAAQAATGQQLYGQITGAGQQLGALGQQLYGQQTGVAQGLGSIGQQQFGQGMTAAQQQAALGNQVYGMGAQTAQNLGALGTGAQTAGLTGAQAQLAAGQQQQQTQQAGLTALYNQFLQQQSYPFQVTQFLANIAEGTGALSGSTTTTQQSGGFFSDERVKEDIEQIGETYDGQKIIKFRYKGEHGPKQIGLSAQDVEKHHPHAVGDYHGIKTVDYDEATKDAAHRGHFYQGGLASMGGAAINDNVRENFDIGGLAGSDQNALLQQLMGRQAVNPYGAAGAAQGAAGLVPTQRNIMTGSMPSRNLMVAQTPNRPQQSGLAQAASFGKDLSSMVGSRGAKDTKTGQYTGGSGLLGAEQGIKDWWNDDSKKTDVTQTDPNKWRGGRMGYATDGSVDDDNMPPPQPEANIDKPKDVDLLKHQGKMIIPDDNPQAKLAVAQSGGGGGGGGGGLGSLLGSAGTFMTGASKILPFFLATGGLAGREHHAGTTNDGSGTVGKDPLAGYDDRDLAIRTIASESGFKDPDETAGIAAVVGNRRQSGKWGDDYKSVVTSKNQFEPWSNPDAPNYPLKIDPNSPRYKMAAEALGRYENEQYDPTGGATHFFAPAAQSALGRKAPNWGQGKLFGATSFHKPGDPDFEGNYDMFNPQVTAGLASKKPLQPLDTGALGAIQKIPAIGSLAKSEEQGGLSEQTKLALLGGLGGMLASPNRSLLGAIGSGITSGVETYQGMGGLGVQQKQAETTAQLGKANIDRINFGIRTGAIRQIGTKMMAFLADGRTIPYGEWKDAVDSGQYLPLQGEGGEGTKPYQPATAQPGQQPQATVEPTMLGENGAKSLVNDHTSFNNSTNWGNEKQISDKVEAEVNNSAIAARQRNNQLLYQAKIINSMPSEGVLAPGPYNNLKTAVFGKYNDIIRSAGGPDGTIGGRPISDFLVDPNELDNKIIAEKMRGAMALNATAGAGQHANRTFEDMLQYLPSGQMPRSAALNIIAGTMISNKADMDAQKYLNDYKLAAMKAHRGAPEAYLAQNARNAFYNDVDQMQYLRDSDQLGKFLHYNKAGKPIFLMDPKEIDPEFWKSTGIDPKTHRYIRGN
jgi:hypothetical protein